MKCHICKQVAEIYLPDRSHESDQYRPICISCLDDLLKVYPNLFRFIQNRELGFFKHQ